MEQLICKMAVCSPALSEDLGTWEWTWALVYHVLSLRSLDVEAEWSSKQELRFAAEINVNTLTWLGDNNKEPHDRVTRATALGRTVAGDS